MATGIAPIRITEGAVEPAALAWLEAIGWRIAHGPDIAPLPALRDALLPQLISGELRVEGAERFVERTS